MAVLVFSRVDGPEALSTVQGFGNALMVVSTEQSIKEEGLE